jgi:ethanolamine ammonia-lyase small subunit
MFCSDSRMLTPCAFSSRIICAICSTMTGASPSDGSSSSTSSGLPINVRATVSTCLQRPDQGRRLDADSRARQAARGAGAAPEGFDIGFVIGDGLSAFAIERNVLPFLDVMLPRVVHSGWRIAPLVIVEQARVAIGDEIGELLRAQLVAVLIGERPGLSSPDSMGIYLTYAPRIGSTDAQRNCISNVRPEGLDVEQAAHKLHYLISEALQRRLTGVLLKDEAQQPLQRLADRDAGNFLTGS